MKSVAITAAVILALAIGTATAAPRALPWGGFEPDDADFGDFFGVPCQTERGLRNILADDGYTHVLFGVIDDDAHRVTGKADQGGVTYRIVMNSCTGRLIARTPA